LRAGGSPVKQPKKNPAKLPVRQQLAEALRDRDAASKCALDLMIVLVNLTDQMSRCVEDAREQIAKAKKGA
jgi:hypothetical protein